VNGYDAARIGAALRRGGGTRRLEVRDEVGSTQDLAFLIAEHGAPDGSLVLADRQTGGRGRLGRRWDSPAGLGAWMSFVLRPTAPAPPGPVLVAATALAVAEAVEGTSGVRASLRWPNDLLAADRKLAGILVETRDFDPAAPLFVLGIGINVSQRESDFPPEVRSEATSLALAGTAPDRSALIEAVVLSLEEWRGRLARGDAASVEDAYASRAAYLGRPVTVLEGAADLAGTLEAASPTSGLRLRLADGSVRTVRPEHARDLRPAP